MEWIIIMLGIMMMAALGYWMSGGERGRLRGQKPLHIEWEIATGEHVVGLLPDNRLEAMRNYSQAAGVSADEAERVVDYLLANMRKAKVNEVWQLNDDAAGLRRLVEAGDIDRAIEVYSAYHGVDEYSARTMIEMIQHEQTDAVQLGADGEIISR